jgi:hypothetical protein
MVRIWMQTQRADSLIKAQNKSYVYILGEIWDMSVVEHYI